MPLTAGTKLGPYEIAAQIGAGGMGEVYRARDTRLGRDVAVKVLPEALSADPKFKQRFEREAKTISQLQHPNVCTLHDVGEQDGVDYLVMEYLEGETLETRLENGALPVEETLRIGREIASAVDAAHRRGIIHRDLKPGNVMITETGAKVLDFGLAREAAGRSSVETQAATAHAITREGTFLGTMPYMAPELLEGRPANEQSDIWALGCVLYEMATGERPFRGRSQADLITAIMGSQPEPPTRKQPLAPVRLDGVVKRCLEKDPEHRWQSGRDMALELQAIREGARGVSSFSLAQSRSVRTMLLVVAVAALAASYWWWLRPQIEVPADRAAEDPVVDRQRLAVLPFDNFSDDPTLDQMALGIAANVIGRHTGQWPVVPRDAAFAETGAEACDAANRLRAAFVMRGEIQRIGDQLRVSAQLVACPDREVVWSRNFDQELVGDFGVQDAIGGEIFQTVQRTLWASYETKVAGRGDPFWHWQQRTREDNLEAERLFYQALQAKSDVAQSWVDAFQVHHQALLNGWFESASETATEIDRLAKGCLAVDERFFNCHFVAAYADFYAGRLDEAVVTMRQSVEFSGEPPQPVPLAIYGLTLVNAGRADEGLAAVREAMERSPEDQFTYAFHHYLGFGHLVAGRYEEASASARRSIAYQVKDPWNQLGGAYLNLAASEALAGRIDVAKGALQEALVLYPDMSDDLLAVLYPLPSLRNQVVPALRQAGLDERLDLSR